jgi:hypothetical protein
MALFTKPEQVVDYLYDYLKDQAEQTGIKFVGYLEERLIPEYPAVLIGAAPLVRELHATHTFQTTYILEIWLYHAKLSESHRVRTRQDLELVTGIRDLLHSHKGLRLRDEDDKPQIIQGWVNAEDPAFIRRPRNEGIVGTRIEWTGISQERF